MKEYDIFLKQRLTEGKIIVYSLPFRDGVSAVNRIVLQALVFYYAEKDCDCQSIRTRIRN